MTSSRRAGAFTTALVAWLALVLLLMPVSQAGPRTSRPPHAGPKPAATGTASPTPAPATTETPVETGSTPLARSVDLRVTAVRGPTGTLLLEYCSNADVDRGTSVARTVVVVVHGDERNACGAAATMMTSAELAGRASDTVVVAPRFLTDSDLATRGETGDLLYWSSGGWKSGAGSLSSPYARPWSISSYASLDQLLAQVTDPLRYPHVTSVVIAGHSAGGQLVNRYAATSAAADRAASGGRLRFVVANPSSYLYLDDQRLAAGEWRALSDGERSACRGFDTYKYGLAGRTGYPAGQDPAVLRERYSRSPVAYLLGSLDVSTTDSSLDTSCAALWQGPQRLERGRRYVQHLVRTLGTTVLDHQSATVVPDVGHSARAVFTSADGVRAVFGTAGSP